MISPNWSGRRATLMAALLVVVPVSNASAQELTHRFISPGFGGNPFNTDYLLGTATVHRPEQPQEPTETPSEEELIARQIQARFLSNLSSQIIDRIQNARPGDSGEFEIGDQIIRFSRSASETRLTFINGRTGETSELVIPDRSGAASAILGARASSAEQALIGAKGRGVGGLGSLAGESGLEIPLGKPGL